MSGLEFLYKLEDFIFSSILLLQLVKTGKLFLH